MGKQQGKNQTWEPREKRMSSQLRKGNYLQTIPLQWLKAAEGTHLHLLTWCKHSPESCSAHCWTSFGLAIVIQNCVQPIQRCWETKSQKEWGTSFPQSLERASLAWWIYRKARQERGFCIYSTVWFFCPQILWKCYQCQDNICYHLSLLLPDISTHFSVTG